MNCFFCCKFLLLKEETYKTSVNEENSGINCNHLSDTKIGDNAYENKLNGEVNRKNILLISRYLKLPKNEITKARGSDSLSITSFCEDCEKISDKLGELCGLLEITQMKVSYYLNLLTDKILHKEQQDINISSFQETFHKKCLTKVAEIDPDPVLQLEKCKIPPLETCSKLVTEETEEPEDQNPNPVLQLEKCDVPPVEVANEEDVTEEPEDINEITEEQYPQIPVLLIPQQLSLEKGVKYSCDFCTHTFQNLANKQRHLEASHSQKKQSSGHLIKSCEFCGAMISSRNLSSHKKRVHGIGGIVENKYLKCECGRSVRDRNMKRHKMTCGRPVFRRKRLPGRKTEEVEMVIEGENGLGTNIPEPCDDNTVLIVKDKNEQISCLEDPLLI